MENNTNWSIDNAHSEVAFKVKHMMISTVTGHFGDFTATAKTNGDNFSNAVVEFSAKTASLDTKNKEMIFSILRNTQNLNLSLNLLMEKI